MGVRDETADGVRPPLGEPTHVGGRRRIGAAMLLLAVALLVAGNMLPWVIRIPLDGAASTAPQGPMYAFDYFSVSLWWFPLALILPAVALAVAGESALRRGQSRILLDLIVASCAIGPVFAVLLLGVMSFVPGIGFHGPAYAIHATWGFWLTATGYVIGCGGCALARRERRKRAAV